MSLTFVLKGTTSQLTANYYPPITLDSTKDYHLGLIGFHTYNSIPNVRDNINNKIHFVDGTVVALPVGSYDIVDINDYINNSLTILNKKRKFSLKPNLTTLKCELSSDVGINCDAIDSICSLIGFSRSRGILRGGKVHQSDLKVEITQVNSIRVECNLIQGSYYESVNSHTLFEYFIDVDPGYSINVTPRNIVYFKVNTSEISNITINLVSQDNKPIDFRGETIIVRLELKEWV